MLSSADVTELVAKRGDKFKILNCRDKKGNQMKMTFQIGPYGSNLYKKIEFRYPGATRVNGIIGLTLEKITNIVSPHEGDYIVILNTYDDVVYFGEYLIDVEDGDLLIKKY